MTNKELLEKIAEAINYSTETIKVITPAYEWDDASRYTESRFDVINPVYLSRILQQLLDNL